MDLSGRRKSTNVEDRRGKGGKVALGGGIGGAIVIALIALLMGKDPSSALQQISSQQVEGTEFVATEQEKEFEEFASKVLASTEDVWSELFKKMGRTYEPPKLVLFKGSVQSGCGGASSSSGPFYCSADRSVYIDLDFFAEMHKTIGAGGDFAYAYVIAHEVGHHVQNLLGTLNDAHRKMASVSKEESNQISVRLELQADFYAGVWGYHENKMFGSLEDGDIEEAINAAGKIGDDYLQKKARGYTTPETFNHGTSAQRTRWLKKGITTGDIKLGDTFSPAYNNL
ncbi:MAG: neutral zinc metallopeptidase [Bacteroidales bacterium]|nr:neutral zinc metallopeptidase [Bacteroidales bacterium]